MEEPMPRWAKAFKDYIRASIIEELTALLDDNSKTDATELKPVQENDGLADHKSDEGETESKPMDLDDPDEEKSNEVEAISIDQSEQDLNEPSTDQIDDENVSELAMNGKKIMKDAIIVPHCSSSPPSRQRLQPATAALPVSLSTARGRIASNAVAFFSDAHRRFRSAQISPAPISSSHPQVDRPRHCCSRSTALSPYTPSDPARRNLCRHPRRPICRIQSIVGRIRSRSTAAMEPMPASPPPLPPPAAVFPSPTATRSAAPHTAAGSVAPAPPLPPPAPPDTGDPPLLPHSRCYSPPQPLPQSTGDHHLATRRSRVFLTPGELMGTSFVFISFLIILI